MLRHVVMFSWAEGVDADHVALVSAGLDDMPSKVDSIRSYQHGADLGLAPANGDYAVVAEFDDVDGYVTYRDHPDHQEFIARCIAGRTSQRFAVQFTVD